MNWLKKLFGGAGQEQLGAEKVGNPDVNITSPANKLGELRSKFERIKEPQDAVKEDKECYKSGHYICRAICLAYEGTGGDEARIESMINDIEAKCPENERNRHRVAVLREMLEIYCAKKF